MSRDVEIHDDETSFTPRSPRQRNRRWLCTAQHRWGEGEVPAAGNLRGPTSRSLGLMLATAPYRLRET
jgi:hypothetical protein